MEPDEDDEPTGYAGLSWEQFAGPGKPEHPDAKAPHVPLSDMPADPFPLTPVEAHILHTIRTSGKCTTENCRMEDPTLLAQAVAQGCGQAFAILISAGDALYAHGEELVGEQLLLAVNAIGEEILRPFLEKGGVV